MASATCRTRSRFPRLLPTLLLLLPLVLSGCALPWAGPPQGEAVVHSPACHCHFSYPASWYFSASNSDTSKPALGLDSFDSNSADHAPVPNTFASIGIDWQPDPIGQLYLAATTRHFSPWPGYHLTVSGWPATSFAHWTAPRSQGGLYVQHVYLFVPWYQRDYDVWFEAADPAGRALPALHGVFAAVLRSLVIVPPNALP